MNNKNKKLYDLIIIGAGPAGITAGIYAGRNKLNTLIITKDFGGQIARKTVAIENYPGFEKISGLKLIERFKKQLEKQKIEIKKQEVKKIKKIKQKFIILSSDKNKYESKSVIITTGADPRPLEVIGEKEFIGRGVSYCSQCDGPLFTDKTVVIVGGGNSAFETAIFLSKIAEKIYILEYGNMVKADLENQERVKKINKIEIITNAAIKEIKGDKFVKSIVYKNMKNEQDIVLAVDGVFVEIGLQPATSFAKDLVDFNERDEIIVDFETCQTKTPGLYAAGDVNVGQYKQIITACGEGAKAALSACQYLKNLNY